MDEERQPLLFRTTNYYFESISNGKPQGDLQVARPVYRQEELNEASNYTKPSLNLKRTLHGKLRAISFFSICSSIMPVLEWLPRYRWKQDILSDIISGITVAIMNIPQGIAYALLGNVHPVAGIYMAFFPVLIYFFFGTSRHISIGTFAIVCLMTGQVVATYSSPTTLNGPVNITDNVEQVLSAPDKTYTPIEVATAVTSAPDKTYTPIEVATAVTFVVAVMQMIMYILRLGVFTNLLSETLVNGFTCGAAFHVISSQLKDLFGLSFTKRRGYFSVLYTFYDALLAIPHANRAAVSISMVAVVSMVLNNEIFKSSFPDRFVVAVMQMIMYILRLGVFTNLLSETLVNGFTCGAAFHVISSQLKDLFGLSFTKRRGYFSVLYTFYDALLAIPHANRAAVSISMVAVVSMVLNNEIFKPLLARKTRVPFPIELMVVVIGTAVCYGFDFHDKYGVTIVGDIPTGLPAPALPAFSLMPHIIVDCLIITIVSYTITISMAFIFAQKAHYEVDANQELLALSLSNGFGSFFSTMPITGSLARSLIQFNTGGVTQIASIVSCSLLLVVLLWVGPLFEYLPKAILASIIVVALKGMLMQAVMLKKFWKLSKAILASIIVVALKGMLMQAVMLKKFWKLSKWDAIVWIVTFLTTVVVSIDIGLLSGIIVSLISIFVRGQRPYTCLLGVVPNTDLYLDCKRFKGVQEIEGIKIFHYCGALNFASKAIFKEQLTKKVGFDVSKVLAKITESKHANQARERDGFVIDIKCIILDFSAVSYIDPVAVHLLRSLASEYSELDIALYVASCSGPIFEMLAKCDKYEGEKIKINIYPTIHDAVLYAKLNEF
ncbi:Sulfate permease family [Popillia japonica]|uniref:Sulfate permease family n=1 Tax=Popillia japonica TaxID=7064 RepID=A0AAW1MUB9_POPJA